MPSALPEPHELAVIELARVEAMIEPHAWDFEAQHAAAIDADWTVRTADNPALFDGAVLLQHRGSLEGDTFRAAYFATRYSRFLAWRQFGWATHGGRNGFAMAALRARDGAFLLGRMGPHTANAGQVYFAAGTPDLDDVTADGRVDLAGSVLRELEEETGLTPADVTVTERWTVVIGGPWAAFMRPATIDLPAEAARALMLERMARQDAPELSDIVAVHRLADLEGAKLPAFMTAYLRRVWS